MLRGTSRSINFRIDNRQFEAVVPGDSVFFSIKDILFNREYELFPQFELMTRPRQVVIDAGAHAGLYTIIASIRAKKVVALEPDEDVFQTLSANIERNRLSNVSLLKSALWKENSLVKFYRRGNSQLGSMRTRKNIEPVMVEAVSLEQLLVKTLRGQGGRVDLLKLDIEGTEFELISGSDGETLERISRIVAEIHTEHGDIRLLTNKLKERGFSYVLAKRPIRKPGYTPVHIVADYKIKLLMRSVNLIIDLSRYSDWSSLLLFASKDPGDFQNLEINSLRGRIMETSL